MNNEQQCDALCCIEQWMSSVNIKQVDLLDCDLDCNLDCYPDRDLDNFCYV